MADPPKGDHSPRGQNSPPPPPPPPPGLDQFQADGRPDFGPMIQNPPDRGKKGG